jgi:hypothetical protein
MSDASENANTVPEAAVEVSPISKRVAFIVREKRLAYVTGTDSWLFGGTVTVGFAENSEHPRIMTLYTRGEADGFDSDI